MTHGVAKVFLRMNRRKKSDTFMRKRNIEKIRRTAYDGNAKNNCVELS